MECLAGAADRGSGPEPTQPPRCLCSTPSSTHTPRTPHSRPKHPQASPATPCQCLAAPASSPAPDTPCQPADPRGNNTAASRPDKCPEQRHTTAHAAQLPSWGRRTGLGPSRRPPSSRTPRAPPRQQQHPACSLHRDSGSCWLLLPLRLLLSRLPWPVSRRITLQALGGLQGLTCNRGRHSSSRCTRRPHEQLHPTLQLCTSLQQHRTRPQGRSRMHAATSPSCSLLLLPVGCRWVCIARRRPSSSSRRGCESHGCPAVAVS